MNKKERQDQIIDVLYQSQNALPLRNIARAVGLKVTPYLRDMVHCLIDEEIVRSERHQMTNGLPIDTYTLTPGFLEYAKEIKK